MGALAAKVNKEDLVLGARTFADSVVKRMLKTMHLPREIADELYSAAYLGLVEAAQNFKFDRGIDFRGYAYLRIRGAVIDSVRQSSALSRNSYWYAKALEAVQELREVNEEPSVLSAHRKISTEEALARVFDFASQGALAFRLCFEDVEVEATEQANTDLNPEERMSAKQNLGSLRKIVETLPEKERKVIEAYYFEDRSFIEIMSDYDGMSKSWVSRLHARALAMVKKRYLEELRKQRQIQ